ncbi:MAG: porin family protein [Brevundimonas sp.]|nr:porin family protein [Brevundimonas sp.]
MKRIILAGLAAAGLSTTAFAADLGAPRSPVPSAIVTAAQNWTGFYAGVHVGYGWGQQRVEDDNPVVYYTVQPRGVFGGFQFGYNYQINNIVLGLEGDLSFGNISHRRAPQNLLMDQVSKTTNLFASARVRGGVVVGDALIYATGGLGYARSRDRNFVGGLEFGPGWQNDRLGWVAGLGVEYGITPNLSVKLEYMHYNFGSWRRPPAPFWGIGTDHFRASMDTVKLGLNYRFSTGPSAVVARY